MRFHDSLLFDAQCMPAVAINVLHCVVHSVHLIYCQTAKPAHEVSTGIAQVHSG